MLRSFAARINEKICMKVLCKSKSYLQLHFLSDEKIRRLLKLEGILNLNHLTHFSPFVDDETEAQKVEVICCSL